MLVWLDVFRITYFIVRVERNSILAFYMHLLQDECHFKWKVRIYTLKYADKVMIMIFLESLVLQNIIYILETNLS